MRNQSPLHESALVAALVTDNDGNVGASLGGYVKAGLVLCLIVVKVPANPYVTKLEGSCESATHFEGSLAVAVESAVNAFPLASDLPSILVVRPALQTHRPPTVAERKSWFRQVH
jgi:hypothetical protein